MKNAIAVIEQQLEVCEKNAPINRERGNVQQAELEEQTARELRKVLDLLTEPELELA